MEALWIVHRKGHSFFNRVESGAYLRIRVYQGKGRHIEPTGVTFIERFQIGNAVLAPARSDGEPLENRLVAVFGIPQPLFDGFSGVKPGMYFSWRQVQSYKRKVQANGGKVNEPFLVPISEELFGMQRKQYASVPNPRLFFVCQVAQRELHGFPTHQ
jgi:hypothetical protein